MAMSPWLPFEWIAATRFLREGRTQSLLIIVGVGVGVSVIVFMSALLSGLQSNLVKRTLSSQSHIVLLPPEEITRSIEVIDQIATNVCHSSLCIDNDQARAKAMSLQHLVKLP